ncbi:MAG: hypothetical protein ACK5NK_11465 [Niabella sp.]
MKAKHLKQYYPLFSLLAVDTTLIILDIVNFYHPFKESKLFQIETNDSYAEDFQHLKWIIIIISLLTLALLRSNWRYLSWVLVFAFLFLEDVFRIHVILTDIFYHGLGLDGGQRLEKITEIGTALFLGFIFLSPVLIAYQKGNALFRKHSKAIFILLLLFLFCAIFLDQIHRLSFIGRNWKYNVFIGILEDGGELITESLLTGYIIYIALKAHE